MELVSSKSFNLRHTKYEASVINYELQVSEMVSFINQDVRTRTVFSGTLCFERQTILVTFLVGTCKPKVLFFKFQDCISQQWNKNKIIYLRLYVFRSVSINDQKQRMIKVCFPPEARSFCFLKRVQVGSGTSWLHMQVLPVVSSSVLKRPEREGSNLLQFMPRFRMILFHEIA